MHVDRALFPCGDAMVCIIDDREDVWKMAPNLVHVRPYRFFDGTADINAPPEASKTDADDKSTEGGVSVKTTRRNVRVVRVPKKPTDDGCTVTSGEDSAAESSSDVACVQNGTSVNNQSEPDVTTTISESSAAEECNEPSAIDVTCSDVAPNETAVKTSAIDNADSDVVVASPDSADDHSAEPQSVDEKISADGNSATNNAVCDWPSSDPADDTKQETSQNDEEYEELVEWEDVDDYLVYLEDILRRIHTAYYELYDQMQLNDDSKNVGAAPDLKTIVPYVRRKVLKGARIVFSGVCPLDTDPTTCRIYRVAESLGAVVQSSVVTGDSASSVPEATTHVVAARPGTEKVKAAARQKSVWIVNPDWLWTCGDRWEWVDERLYPLNDETSARFLSRDSPVPGTADPRKRGTASNNSRKIRPTSSQAAENNGLDVYSLVTLSKEDISGMDAEVEKILDEDADSEYEDDETETETSGDVIKESLHHGTEDNEDDAILRKQVLSSYGGIKRKYEESSDEESLSGDFPKGWKDRSRKRHRVSVDGNKLVTAAENDGDADDDDDDGAGSDNSQSENLSSSASLEEDFNESVGSMDEEIAAAVEKEFLS